MGRVHVKIPKYAAETRTAIDETTLAEVASTGAGIGAGIGSVIPGIGTAVGGAVGAAVATLADIFGIVGKKPRTVDVVREILHVGFSSALPGKAGKNRYDAVVLTGQFARSSIKEAIDEIGGSVLASLEPGSDAYIALGRAFHSYRIVETESESDWKTVLIFDEIDYSQQDTQNSNGLSDSGSGAIAGLGLLGLLAALSQ